MAADIDSKQVEVFQALPDPGTAPPVQEPEPDRQSPVEEPDFPDDPGPAEDPGRQPIKD